MRQPPYVVQRQLWISRGDPQNAQPLENAQLTGSAAPYFSVAASPDGGEIAYLNGVDKQLFRKTASNNVLETLPSVAVDLAQWTRSPNYFRMAWRPGSSQILLYSTSYSSTMPSYAFLLDTDNGQVCGVDLSLAKGEASGSPVLARWSPNGRYLAIIRWDGYRNPNSLVALDAANGEVHEISAESMTPPEIAGLHIVNDIAWAPDNRHLAALTQVQTIDATPNQEAYKFSGLYLVDPFAPEFLPISNPTQPLGSTLGQTNLVWSADGSGLLVRCGAQGVDALCFLSVGGNSQP
jgi:hypothetical protein